MTATTLLFVHERNFYFMKQKNIAGITAALASTTLLATTACASDSTYVVSAGDNLYRLAIQFNTTVDAIAKANGITNPHWIYVDQTLTIPASTSGSTSDSTDSTSGSSSTAGYHYVVKGDTLSQLAKTYGTTVQQLAAWNGIQNIHFIREGWSLKVSSTASTGSTDSTTVGSNQHLVVKGDNLWDLSIKYGTTVSQLATWNNVRNIHLIYVGQVLTISGKGTDTAGALYGEDSGAEITKDMTPDAVSYEEWLEAMAAYAAGADETISQEVSEITEELAESGEEVPEITEEVVETTEEVAETTEDVAESTEEGSTVEEATAAATVDVSVDVETADVLEAEFGDVVEVPTSILSSAVSEISYDYSEPVEEAAPVVEEVAVVKTHTVAEDCSLFQIAPLFNASIPDLLQWNNLTDAYDIPAGTILIVG